MSTLSANDMSESDYDVYTESKTLTLKTDIHPGTEATMTVATAVLRAKDSKKTPLIRKALSNGIASFTNSNSQKGMILGPKQGNNRRLLTRTMAPRSVRFSEMARQERGENALLARRRVIRLLVAIIVAFALCVLPNHIRMLWEQFSMHQRTSRWTYLIPPILHLIVYSNSALNPVL